MQKCYFRWVPELDNADRIANKPLSRGHYQSECYKLDQNRNKKLLSQQPKGRTKWGGGENKHVFIIARK